MVCGASIEAHGLELATLSRGALLDDLGGQAIQSGNATLFTNIIKVSLLPPTLSLSLFIVLTNSLSFSPLC